MRRSLEWADEAAATLDFAGALSWLAAVEGTGDRLPEEYEDKRRAWAAAQAQTPATVSSFTTIVPTSGSTGTLTSATRTHP